MGKKKKPNFAGKSKVWIPDPKQRTPQELKCGCVVFIVETIDDAILTFDRRCRAVRMAEDSVDNPARLIHLAHMHVAKMQGKA